MTKSVGTTTMANDFYSHERHVIDKAKSKVKANPKQKSQSRQLAQPKGRAWADVVDNRTDKDKAKIACSFFAKGTCWAGDKCKYRHERPEEAKGTDPKEVVSGVVVEIPTTQHEKGATAANKTDQVLCATCLAAPTLENEGIPRKRQNRSQKRCLQRRKSRRRGAKSQTRLL